MKLLREVETDYDIYLQSQTDKFIKAQKRKEIIVAGVGITFFGLIMGLALKVLFVAFWLF